MDILKLIQDANYASINYADSFKYELLIHHHIYSIVKSRTTKKDYVKDVFQYPDDISLLQKSVKRYYDVYKFYIRLYLGKDYELSKESEIDITETIIDRLKLLNDYKFYAEPTYLYLTRNDNELRITYEVYTGTILVAPKRTK